MIFCYVGLITVILTTLVQAVTESDIKRKYRYDCAIYEANIKQTPDKDYKYELELLGPKSLKAVETLNKVELCDIPMCKNIVLKFDIYEKKKNGSEFRNIFSKQYEKSLEAPKISELKARFAKTETIINWKLQDYENCKDKELQFFLFGDKTVMQMAKGQEIRIPFLTRGKTYTVYAFPNHMDTETAVYTNTGVDIKVP
uniref:Secreted protein n=1 Tax=Schistosoma mansoni TaxID=6183 RepID=A0A5K4FA80_SCHMA